MAVALIAVGELTSSLLVASPIFAPSRVIAPVEDTDLSILCDCFISFIASRLTPPLPPEISSLI